MGSFSDTPVLDPDPGLPIHRNGQSDAENRQ
jgi:hypothetical protein